MRLLIKEHREAIGLTVRQLSELTGVSKNRISKLEVEGGDITLSTLFKLARGLRIHPTELVDWGDHHRTE